jgi:methyl-accepting chemotaxis protein
MPRQIRTSLSCCAAALALLLLLGSPLRAVAQAQEFSASKALQQMLEDSEKQKKPAPAAAAVTARPAKAPKSAVAPAAPAPAVQSAEVNVEKSPEPSPITPTAREVTPKQPASTARVSSAANDSPEGTEKGTGTSWTFWIVACLVVAGLAAVKQTRTFFVDQATRSVGRKLAFSFGGLIAILAVAVSVVRSNMAEIQQLNGTMVEHRVPATEYSMDMLNGVNQSQSALQNYMLTGGEKARTARRDAWESQIQPALAKMKEIARSSSDGKMKAQLSELEPLAAELRRCQEETEDQQATNPSAARQSLSVRAIPAASAVSERLEELESTQRDRIDAEGRLILDSTAGVQVRLILLLVLGTLVASGVAYAATRGIVGPIKEVIANIANADLNMQFNSKRKDEVGELQRSFDGFVSSIKQTLLSVAEATGAVASASSQISSSTEEMAAGAQEQNNQTASVAAAVEQMTATIVENAKNASSTADTAKRAKLAAEQGGQAVTETVEGMKRIASVVNRSAETVKALGRSSDQIGEIIAVIDEIADQTNLLALNAAIEAARAGEQGRGFAVVADEVRALAERTTKATKEIATMITSIQTETTGAVTSMHEGTVQVGEGIKIADRAGESLKEIVEVSQAVTDMVAQIASASKEQSVTSEQISKNIDAISSVTGETSQGVQQVAQAAEDLNRLTENLQAMVLKFNLHGAGKAQAGAAAGSPAGSPPKQGPMHSTKSHAATSAHAHHEEAVLH